MDLVFQPAGKLFTVDEYWALGETEYRCELQEGMIVPRPSLPIDHQMAKQELWVQVRSQLPEGFEAVGGVDVDLELVPPDQPGFCRCPDLIVVGESEIGDSLIRASDVCLVVEIVSAGTRRMDHQNKRAEYADAGIPHYWIIDLGETITVLACELAEDGYVDNGGTSGLFTTAKPFPMTVDLSGLVRW